ncbi:hypothetical protein TD95_003984 [Thielaviopsis punctulata]|uniref:Glycosylphosphatidylinositol anchor biosynthesis protein 11 n=1 Tax=Thielaviopsis punctulata TaxID=72032 RepID=A0A0F4Z7E7_9PEZI|nr:hypothetical protein TD95_003984 [Thielaviopsis punctulata]
MPSSKGARAAAPNPTAEAPPPPSLAPVPMKSDTLSLAVQVAQPVTIAGVFYGAFPLIVASPITGLQNMLAFVTVLQVVYVLACVPVVATKSKLGRKKIAERGNRPALFSCILSLLLSLLITPFVHLILVLFGGPFLTHVPHTLLCAAHFSVLCCFPLFYAHGVEAPTWLAIGSLGQPLDATYGAFCGGLVGAWLGAVPIPLDWDREWQKWPLTIVCGMYLGVAVGRLVAGCTPLYGKRVVQLDMPVKEE